MSERERFYALRDLRTEEYGVPPVLAVPVGVAIGRDAAETKSGQLCVLALLNMLARLHRSLRIVVPDLALLVRDGGKMQSLTDACLEAVRKVDPFNDVLIESEGSKGFLPEGCSIGLGHLVPAATLHIGATGFLGEIGADAIDFSDYGSYYIGAGVAACLGAAAALRLAARQRVQGRRVSFWGYREGDAAIPGPHATVTALDVGDVWMVGAGGVGSAVAYWLQFPGVRGSWTVIDKERIELHNTNRTLSFFPADAGWPDGEASDKATLAATAIGAKAVVDEYSHWVSRFEGRLPDLVLPLANDDGVRHAISCLGQPLLVHAATGRNWESHLHRHIVSRDDCIDCRLPGRELSQFKCSEGTLPAARAETGNDAALPFLSAAAGLMLVASLLQLEQGSFLIESVNRRSFLLDLEHSRSWQEGTCSCSESCPGPPERDLRRRIHRDSRWGYLD